MLSPKPQTKSYWCLLYLSKHRYSMTNTLLDHHQQQHQYRTPPPPHLAWVTHKRGVPGWECWESLWRWRPRAGAPGWGGRALCAPTVSFVWAEPAGTWQSLPHPQPQMGSTRAAWTSLSVGDRRGPPLHHSSYKKTLSSSQKIKAPLAANECCRPIWMLFLGMCGVTFCSGG